MKQEFVFILVMTLIMSLITPVIARMGDDGREQMEDRGMVSEMMEVGKDMREERGMHGMGFLHSDDNEYGEYVSFTIDNSGKVLNYGIMGNILFNMSIAGFNYRSTDSSDSVTRVLNTDSSTIIQLHDNPSAMINIQTTKSITITFTLAEGINATREDNLVKIESGSVVGYILGSGTIISSIDGKLVKVDASPNSVVIFRAAPVNMPMLDHMYQRFSREISRNRVGMEVAFGRNRTFNAINYSKGLQLKIQEMDKDRITMRINSTDLDAGRIIAINLDNSTLEFRERERLKVRYDNQSIECVDDANIFFNITDRLVCWISPVQEQVRAQLMIHIPKYSEHTIEILAEPEVTPTIAPGERIITLDNNRQTITLQINERFLLKLGEGYDWNITVDDQTVVSSLSSVTVEKGAQGMYEAHKPGNTTLTAVGDPVCRREQPPCMAPSILFQIHVIVKGVTTSPATSGPGFEVFIAIAALVIVLVRRRLN